MNRLVHISHFLSGLLAGLPTQRHSGRTGRVVIDTLTENPEVLVGLLRQAAEAGLLTSIHDVSYIQLNGRHVSASILGV